MTKEAAIQEAHKMLDPFYMWSTIINNSPQQVADAIAAEGIYLRDFDHLVKTIDNLIRQQKVAVLKNISSRIKFDFSNAPKDYEMVITEVNNLIKTKA